MVNDLRHQGVEVQIARQDATLGKEKIAAGDYIIRADQPYRTLVDMYFSLQNYPVSNPLPYDDTGWTMPLMRNVAVRKIADKGLFDQPMTPVTADIAVPGAISGSGPVLVVENNTDTTVTVQGNKLTDGSGQVWVLQNAEQSGNHFPAHDANGGR